MYVHCNSSVAELYLDLYSSICVLTLLREDEGSFLKLPPLCHKIAVCNLLLLTLINTYVLRMDVKSTIRILTYDSNQ